MEVNVLAPEGFCCSSEAECKRSIRPGDRFFEGTLSHVGHHYDVTLGDKPLRVVAVGQEDGLYSPLGPRKTSGVTLAERYEAIHGQGGLRCRYYADGTHPARSIHMRGTTSALRVLFGKGLGADWDDEFVVAEGGDRFHLFDAFALVNVLLCSAGPPGSSSGRSSRTMRRNCMRHFAATLEILEPTVLILQGIGVQDWIAPVMEKRRALSPYLAEAEVGGQHLLVCQFSHPTARAALRWGDRLDSQYLVSVVEPTLRQAVAELPRRGRAKASRI